ncbi:MAG: hypothetical protein ACW97Z_01035 [Candidatus Hodarchaeales archaeon]|jgi:hypothetical protein
MALAKSYQNSPPPLLEDTVIEVNLDSLILAMFTAFNVQISDKDLILNIANLFSELNLVIPENLNSEIRSMLKILTLNNFLIAKEGEFSISELGRDHGLKALLNFRESAPEFFRN